MVCGEEKMSKLKKIFTNWRVILLLIFLIFAVVTIQPQVTGNDGAAIRSVVQNSTASQAGIANPSPRTTPLQKEMITSLNGETVTSAQDYYTILQKLPTNKTVKLETNKGAYTLLVPSPAKNESIDLGMKVYDAPTTNLRKGLDLEGGTRVLLKSSEKVDKETIELTASSLRERLNVYGLSDIVVKPAADLAGNNFILVEIAGATEEEVKELLAKQGKFEAKIGNDTVFFGGKKDITYVCRTADCSGIDSRRGCSKVSDGYACGFIFGITLSPEAAQRQADLTKSLTVSTENGQSYLSQDITLYLDDQEVDRLRIGAELKGRASTDIQISGGGNGRTENEAISNTLQNMDRLRTIIITGSLPIKLEVAKMDTISPTLGKEFLNNIFFVGFLAMVAVGAVVAIRYRKLKIIVPMILTLCSEVMLILGFAALAGTNLDLAAIAGIIIVIGTGVDHLIIITDEALRGGSMAEAIDWKKKIKNAMFIIFGTYLVNLSGMIVLFSVGAGLLKGFAVTTIVGASFGVLIARPAYAAVAEILLKE